MFARVSTFRTPPDQVEEGIRSIREQVVPGAWQMEGFNGLYFLVDRESGKALMVALWESEEDMRTSEEETAKRRVESTQTLGVEVESVERYEVVVSPD